MQTVIQGAEAPALSAQAGSIQVGSIQAGSALTTAPRGGIVLVAPPGSRRVRAYQTTLAGLGLPPARVVAYTDLLAGHTGLVGHTGLAEALRPGDLLRYESPGEDWPTERALLDLGLGLADEAEPTPGAYVRTAPPVQEALGCLWSSRQWFLGFREALRQLELQRQAAAPHHVLNPAPDILTMFDKAATTGRLTEAGVPVPPGQWVLNHPDEALLGEYPRLFVKLAHGSGAAGALALHVRRSRVAAYTTVQLEGGQLYNSRRVRRLDHWAEVRALLAALVRQRAVAEVWLPKAQLAGRFFDLRVVVIGGRAAQVLVRLARGPFTNLHLGNERGDLGAVQAWLGPDAWKVVLSMAEAAAACFPGSLSCGVDVLVRPNRQPVVLEVNAFGDYHRGVLVDGLDTYGVQLRALGWLHPGPPQGTP